MKEWMNLTTFIYSNRASHNGQLCHMTLHVPAPDWSHDLQTCHSPPDWPILVTRLTILSNGSSRMIDCVTAVLIGWFKSHDLPYSPMGLPVWSTVSQSLWLADSSHMTYHTLQWVFPYDPLCHNIRYRHRFSLYSLHNSWTQTCIVCSRSDDVGVAWFPQHEF